MNKVLNVLPNSRREVLSAFVRIRNNNSIKNLKYKAKQKGINVDNIVPRGYNKLSDEEKYEIVQNLQEKL